MLDPGGLLIYAAVRIAAGLPLMSRVVVGEAPADELIGIPHRAIVVPLEKLDAMAEEVAATACRLAAESDARVVGVSAIVVPVREPLDAPRPDRDEEAARVQAMARSLAGDYGVEYTGVVRRTRMAGRTVVDVAADEDAGLIVIGAPAKRRLAHSREEAFFGKTVDFVLRKASCRVLVTHFPAGVAAETSLLTWQPKPDPSHVWLPREPAVVPRLLAVGGTSAAAAEGAAVAVALAVYAITDSTAWVSGALLATLGLSALISPFAGVMADRHDRRRLMIGVAVVEVPVFVLAAAAQHAWEIIALVAVAAAVQRLFDAALGASIPALVPDEGLPRATSSFAAAQQTALLLSPAAVGAIIATGGHRWAFAAVAALYAVTWSSSSACPGRGAPGRGASGAGRRAARGLVSMVGDRVVLWTTVAMTVLLVFSAFTLVAGVALAEQEFHAGGTAYGFMVGCLGRRDDHRLPGRRRLAERRGELGVFAAGMGPAGFALGLVSIAPTLAVALGMLAVGGAGNGLMSASGQLLFQRRVPNAVWAGCWAPPRRCGGSPTRRRSCWAACGRPGRRARRVRAGRRRDAGRAAAAAAPAVSRRRQAGQDHRRLAIELEGARAAAAARTAPSSATCVRITMCTPSGAACCTTWATDTPRSAERSATWASTPGRSSTRGAGSSALAAARRHQRQRAVVAVVLQEAGAAGAEHRQQVADHRRAVSAPPAPGPSRIISRIESPCSSTALKAPSTAASGCYRGTSRQGWTRGQIVGPAGGPRRSA